MQDFKYIIGPQFLWSFLNIHNYGIKKMLAYGYLMRHQFCPLEIFEPYEVENGLQEYFDDRDNIKYISETDSFIVYNGVSLIEDIRDVLDRLCLKMYDCKENGNDIVFKIESMFSDEEINYNRKRFSVYYS